MAASACCSNIYRKLSQPWRPKFESPIRALYFAEVTEHQKDNIFRAAEVLDGGQTTWMSDYRLELLESCSA